MLNDKRSFKKIVSPPSATAWAQTYHAGNVYAVVSVIQKEERQENPEHAIPSVHVLGKDIINNLEAEYFAIATKNFQTIKEAVSNACKDISDTVLVTVIFAVVENNLLYLFLYGSGQIAIKRKEKFGILLEQKNKQQVIASSGFLESADTIILASQQVSKVISVTELQKQMARPISEIAEELVSKFDDEKYAGAALLMLTIGIDEKTNQEIILPRQSSESEPFVAPVASSDVKAIDREEKLNLGEKQKKKFLSLSFRQFFFLALSIVLIGILGASIFITKQKQQVTQSQILFASEFPSAKKHVEEGESLLSLNKNLAQDDFLKAKTSLERLKTKLPSNATELREVTLLLEKVNQLLASVSEKKSITLIQTKISASNLLSAEIAYPNALYFAQSASAIYMVDASEIAQLDSSNVRKEIIKNKNDWSDLGGFGTYLGNFYVLDKKANKIIKFTKTDSEYARVNYFTTDTVELSTAVSFSIDGSLWILFHDGSIKKFTKGNSEPFVLSGLTTPLHNPTRIVTSDAMENLYILDNEHSRIVVIKKDTGKFVMEYVSKEIKNAKDIDIDEKNKKLFLLIQNTVFLLTLQ